MAIGWRVVAQQQREELTASGGFSKVWDITFEIPSGTRGIVTIPERLYEEEYVRSVIESQARQVSAVESL